MFCTAKCMIVMCCFRCDVAFVSKVTSWKNTGSDRKRRKQRKRVFRQPRKQTGASPRFATVQGVEIRNTQISKPVCNAAVGSIFYGKIKLTLRLHVMGNLCLIMAGHVTNHAYQKSLRPMFPTKPTSTFIVKTVPYYLIYLLKILNLSFAWFSF